MPFCSNCGNELIEGAKFCCKCGFAVDSTTISSESSQTAKDIEEEKAGKKSDCPSILN